jgi:hypothetical protein
MALGQAHLGSHILTFVEVLLHLLSVRDWLWTFLVSEGGWRLIGVVRSLFQGFHYRLGLSHFKEVFVYRLFLPL